MTRVRGRVGTLVVAAALSIVIMLIVQRLFLVLPTVSALPAGMVGGLFAVWSRPSAEAFERLVTAAGAAAVTVVALGLWMSTSTPSGFVVQVLLGWVVVAVELTAVHMMVTVVAPFVRRGARRDPVGRLR